jgi:hypothetical protein
VGGAVGLETALAVSALLDVDAFRPAVDAFRPAVDTLRAAVDVLRPAVDAPRIAVPWNSTVQYTTVHYNTVQYITSLLYSWSAATIKRQLKQIPWRRVFRP